MHTCRRLQQNIILASIFQLVRFFTVPNSAVMCHQVSFSTYTGWWPIRFPLIKRVSRSKWLSCHAPWCFWLSRILPILSGRTAKIPELPIARCNGPIKDQANKVSQLIRNGITIVWQNGVDHCWHIKLPEARKPFFDQLMKLFQPQNLQDPDHTINVKSAKLGEVKLISIHNNVISKQNFSKQ